MLERELKSLQRTKDHYPKFLLTLDMDLEADYNGITKINVIEWLLDEKKVTSQSKCSRKSA